MRVFSHDNCHIWTKNNPHAVWEQGYGGHLASNMWAGIISDTVVGLSLLPNSPTAEHYCNFLETVLPRLHEGVPVAVRQRFWFCHSGAPALHGEDIISRKVDWTWRVHCMASLAVGFNFARYFPVRTS
jgi:hypothetical protein